MKCAATSDELERRGKRERNASQICSGRWPDATLPIPNRSTQLMDRSSDLVSRARHDTSREMSGVVTTPMAGVHTGKALSRELEVRPANVDRGPFEPGATSWREVRRKSRRGIGSPPWEGKWQRASAKKNVGFRSPAFRPAPRRPMWGNHR